MLTPYLAMLICPNYKINSDTKQLKQKLYLNFNSLSTDVFFLF